MNNRKWFTCKDTQRGPKRIMKWHKMIREIRMKKKNIKNMHLCIFMLLCLCLLNAGYIDLIVVSKLSEKEKSFFGWTIRFHAMRP